MCTYKTSCRVLPGCFRVRSSPHPGLLELVTVYPTPRPKAGHGFACSEWAVLACRGAPRSRAPLARCPAAPGCRLTHARAGSGGTGIAPTHASAVVQPGACAADGAGSRCRSGGVAPVGSQRRCQCSLPPPKWVSEPLSWVSCSAAFQQHQEGILGSGRGGSRYPNPPGTCSPGYSAPELVASEERPRHTQ